MKTQKTKDVAPPKPVEPRDNRPDGWQDFFDCLRDICNLPQCQNVNEAYELIAMKARKYGAEDAVDRFIEIFAGPDERDSEDMVD